MVALNRMPKWAVGDPDWTGHVLHPDRRILGGRVLELRCPLRGDPDPAIRKRVKGALEWLAFLTR